MQLLGRYFSGYVRRVAVSLKLLDIPFERKAWCAYAHADELRKLNPLGKIPVLVLDDGQVMIESSTMLDHIDRLAGAERARVPPEGRERREVQWLVALALGANDKAAQLYYERAKRPKEKVEPSWEARIQEQLRGGLAAIDALIPNSPWIGGDRLTQADVTTVCMYSWLPLEADTAPEVPPGRYPNLEGLAARLEALPAFRETRPRLNLAED